MSHPNMISEYHSPLILISFRTRISILNCVQRDNAYHKSIQISSSSRATAVSIAAAKPKYFDDTKCTWEVTDMGEYTNICQPIFSHIFNICFRK